MEQNRKDPRDVSIDNCSKSSSVRQTDGKSDPQFDRDAEDRPAKETKSRKTTGILSRATNAVKLAIPYVLSLRYFLRGKDATRKSIFLISYGFKGGGVQRVVTTLASELASRYRVTLLYVGSEKGIYPISPKVEIARITEELFDHPERFSWLARWIRALKKRRGVYASISFLYLMNSLNVASKADDVIVCTERNNPSKNEFEISLFERIKELYEQADHVVFQSERVRSLFNDAVKAHSSILPNPVGVTCDRKSETKRRIVNAGRLVAQKNQALLIRAFRRFHEIHPDYSLSIYGIGFRETDVEGELRNLIEELNLQDSVILEGLSTRICEDIADAEFFVLSSDFEGMSNALLEAMTTGFPCVSTDCEGSTDVIEDGVNGLLIPRGDEDALLKAMLTLAEQEEYRERLGRQAKITAERFRKEKVAEEWTEMIESL